MLGTAVGAPELQVGLGVPDVGGLTFAGVREEFLLFGCFTFAYVACESAGRCGERGVVAGCLLPWHSEGCGKKRQPGPTHSPPTSKPSTDMARPPSTLSLLVVMI